MLNNFEAAFLFRQLYYLLKNGITLFTALKLLYNDKNCQSFKKPLLFIINELKEGKEFSEVLEKTINLPNYLVNIIKIGEHNGELHQALLKAYTLIERQQKLKKQVQNVLSYPLILLVMSCFIVFWLLIKVLPQFKYIYSQTDTRLPLPTTILFAIHSWFAVNWWIPLVIFLITFVLVTLIYRKKIGLLLHRALFLVPISGTLAYYYTVINFLSTLGALHNSGLSVYKSVHLSIDAVHNKYIKAELSQVSTKLVEGVNLSDALADTKLFSDIIIQLIRVGEETAELDKVLLNLTEYLYDELDIYLKRIISLIEPISLLIVGALIIFIALAFLLPLFNMSSILKYAH